MVKLNTKRLSYVIYVIQYTCIFGSLFERDNECAQTEELLNPVEFYKEGDSLFMLFVERVAWFEAKSICKTNEAHLCIPNSTAKANFINHFLSESIHSQYEDFWIGGRKMNEQWIWLDGQLVKDSNISTLWPWNDNNPEKDCLAFERQKHITPMLVGLSCYILKPFICERALWARTTKPLPTLPLHSAKIDGSTFTFYHSRVTWQEALGFCRSLGQRLAIIPNKKLVKLLRTEILRTRPNIENAWIGGYYHKDKWIWISTGTIIPGEVKNDYPPWYSFANQGCLLFDRHFTSAYFLPSRCEKKRDLICEQYTYVPKPLEIDLTTVECIHVSTIMYINFIDKNWSEAKQICNNNNTILAEPMDNETVKAIAVCLSDHPAEPKHVWIGGKYKESRWIWFNSMKEVDNSLPWCEDEFEKGAACLNLDRTDHDEPWIYGLKCNIKQPFACQEGTILTTEEVTTTTPLMTTTTKPITTTTTELVTTTTKLTSTTELCVCECHYPTVPMHYNNNTYIAFMFEILPDDIFYYCKYFGGIPYSIDKPQDVHKYVFAYTRLSIQLCQECCTYDMINFWAIDHLNNLCNLINLGTNHISTNVPDCEKKNYFFCVTNCIIEPKLVANENATIDCKWMKAAGAIPYKSCKFSCGEGYTIFGPDRFECNFYGWIVYTAEATTQPFMFPECIKTEYSARMLIDILKGIEPNGLYFVVHERNEMEPAKWVALLQFIASIIQVYPLSENFPFGLLTYGENAKTRIPYNAKDTCQVLKKLRHLMLTKDANHAFYDKAFLKVKEGIETYQPNRRKNLIFLLTDRENNGDDYNYIVSHLQKENDIFVVGLTRDKFIFDLDMVANLGRTYRLHTMKVMVYSDLTSISLDLLEFRSSQLNCSENLYVMPGLKLEIEDERRAPKLHLDLFIFQGITYYVIKNLVKYAEAKSECRKKYGGMLIQNTTALDLVNNVNLKQYHIDFVWVDSGKRCTLLDIYDRRLRNRKCTVTHPYLCAIDCSVTPTGKLETYGNNEPSISFNCHENEKILWGPPELFCNASKAGWFTRGMRASSFPKCINFEEWSDKLVSILDLKRDKYKAGILFVLDEALSIHEYQFQIQIGFVETIAKLYPASKVQPFGLITYSATPKLRIPYSETDSCSFLKKLTTIKREPAGGEPITSYEKALLMIDQQISEFRFEDKTLVFFLTNGILTDEISFVKRAWSNLLRHDVETFIFKIGEFESYLTSEIATRDYKYNFNLYSFHSHYNFDGLMGVFEGKLDCSRIYDEDKDWRRTAKL